MTEICSEVLAQAMPRPLKNWNVVIDGRRTTLRLEPSLWDAFLEISARERMPVGELCGEIKRRVDKQRRNIEINTELADGVVSWEEGASLLGADQATAAPVTLATAIRVFIISYFRRLADEGRTRRPRNAAGRKS